MYLTLTEKTQLTLEITIKTKEIHQCVKYRESFVQMLVQITVEVEDVDPYRMQNQTVKEVNISYTKSTDSAGPFSPCCSGVDRRVGQDKREE